MKKHLFVYPILSLLVLVACRPADPVPKPKGYFRIDLPEHAYRMFDSSGYPFTFAYPVYGHISRDTNLSKDPSAAYWLNVDIPELNATIYLSYKRIGGDNPLTRLVDESYKLSYAHDVKADYIKTPQFVTPNGLIGVYYNVGGNAASAYQFFVTDTMQHFIRGALYFNVTPNVDSLKPAANFLEKDMEHLINTLQFK